MPPDGRAPGVTMNQGWQGGAACAACGGFMDPSRSTYDNEGRLVCPACAARGPLAEGEGRAMKSLTGAAIVVLIAGVLSWTCLNAFFILSIAAVASGIGWLLMIARPPEYRAKMGTKFVLCVVAACIGTALGAMPL